MMRNNRYRLIKHAALILFRLLAGGVFVYASVDKILHPDQFAIAVNNYQLLPEPFVNVFAVTGCHNGNPLYLYTSCAKFLGF